ncbi:putative quinol monooxygenase [Caulobacter segnis]|uniref:putative quinol monooxygenase n=1 Tax=Caulobacter segnis TaxID=88688 RepID=UPI00240F3E46|nr:putative quinol monooxygenase [Caulobacter segnis]MDG2523355.1 putative quinol monooxygenase [Caulobacter segnis]
MTPDRREVVTGSLALGLAGVTVSTAAGAAPMYGLIGKMKATPGQRDALIGILLEGVSGMPGCLSYVVSKAPDDADAIWITEVWDSADSHKASLKLPSVQAAIAKGRPLIAAFESHVETTPVGGHGLK